MEECQAKQKVKAEKGDTAYVNYPMEVTDANGMKWNSVCGSLHDQIPVVHQDAGEQLWLLERAEHESLWSFSPSSGEKKLYVSYNRNDPTDESLTLEYADDVTKGRYFKLLLQPGGRLHVRLPDLPERVIGIRDNVLALVHPGESSEECLKWGLSAESKIGFLTVEMMVTIREYNGSRFVHHHESGLLDPVEVGLSEDSEWRWSRWTHESAFKVPRKWLYISSDSKNKIRYHQSIIGPTKAMEFKMKTAPHTKGIVLESDKYPGHYIGIEDVGGRGDTFLSLVDENKAVGWIFDTARLVMQIGNKEIFIPPY